MMIWINRALAPTPPLQEVSEISQNKQESHEGALLTTPRVLLLWSALFSLSLSLPPFSVSLLRL